MSPEFESTTITPPTPIEQTLPAAPHEDKDQSQPARPPRRKGGFHFRATVGRFDAPADRALFNELAHWVEEYFREDDAVPPSTCTSASCRPT